VLVDGAPGHSVTDDPYEFIYQNLPQRHRLRNVPDCGYCGAIRFQYENPDFVAEKEK
jgi:5-methylcytosine-specific restriction endonuclease McrA